MTEDVPEILDQRAENLRRIEMVLGRLGIHLDERERRRFLERGTFCPGRAAKHVPAGRKAEVSKGKRR